MANNNNSSLAETHSTKHVFLSYSRTDRGACNTLRALLEQAGLETFRDEDNIRIGDQWLSRLEKALQNCSAFVVLIGRDGIKRWVGAEVEIALKRYLSPHIDAERLPIFPILLDGASPELLPPFLSLIQMEQWKSTDPLPETLVEAIKTKAIRTDNRQTFEGCPFLGLSAFGKDDAQLFFGRRKETLEALACLGDQQQTNPDSLNQSGGTAYNHWLQIEGNTGAGKSSLVKAGMLPMIEHGALWPRTGFDHWSVIGPMMPGKKPLEKLAETLEQGLISTREKRDSLGRLNRLKADQRALAFTIKDFKQANSAFLLIIDQFEELFTFAEEEERKQFDALLTNALQDPECPLFLISTIRADFLDRFELLTSLQTLYNNHCKRYFLPIISEQGLREIIEQPAHLAGLDVSEVTIPMLNDAKNEVGALPLVENALHTLWQHRTDGNCLSGEIYLQKNGLAGMLSSEANNLLDRIGKKLPNGSKNAMELLLRLVHINDNGRHSRQRITREEAVDVAGDGNKEQGEKILWMLSGGRDEKTASNNSYTLRLISIIGEKEQHEEKEQQYVDLIHETLIRARYKDEKTGKLVGYWPELYNYIDQNRDRDMLRQQIKIESKRWQESKWLGSLWHLSFSFTNNWWNYRKLRLPKNSPESRYFARSRFFQAGLIVLFLGVLSFILYEKHVASKHDYPFDVIVLISYTLGINKPLPEMVTIPAGRFMRGNEDADKVPIEIKKPFQLGKYEVTYEQYDYYIWTRLQQGHVDARFPAGVAGGRGNQPVVNVSYQAATAYAVWLGDQIDTQCRLPTQFEWEYAARAPENNIDRLMQSVDNANCTGCDLIKEFPKEAVSVNDEGFKDNPFELRHMLGNVWEWTCSSKDSSSEDSPQECPENDEFNSFIVMGGYWESTKEEVRELPHEFSHISASGRTIGFRVRCSVPST